MKALDVLRVVGHTDWGGDRTVLLRLYRALVRSKLDYGLDLTTYRKAETPDPIYFHGLQQILADFPGFRRIFTDGSKSEDGRVGAAAVMDVVQLMFLFCCGLFKIRSVCRAPRPVSEEERILAAEASYRSRPVVPTRCFGLEFS
nr:hypothetical protein BaRGS_030389 [Batillaria attramentaria]